MKPIKLSQFPDDTYIFIKPKKRREIFQKLEKEIKYLSRGKNIYSGTLYYWKYGYCIKNNKKIKRYIHLPNLKKLCKTIKININDLQPYIQEIKTSSRSETIKNPKLPLKIIPETFSILGHMLGDGYGGEIGRSVYTNISKEARENFIKNLKKSFGNVYYSTNKNHPIYVSIAKIVPKILKKYFGIKDFRNGKPKITNKIYNAPKKYLIEFIKAIIIDEGSIRDRGIEIGLTANPRLTKQLKKICINRLNYSCKSYKNTFMISAKSYNQIYKDMNHLVIPKKQQMLLKYFRRKSRKWYNQYKNHTKKQIIKQLFKRPMTAQELGNNLDIYTSGIRDHIGGYNLKGKRIPGLLNLDIIKVKELGWRKTQIFDINNKNKALAFLGDRFK